MPITKETLDFLVENRLRNNREWYQAHKDGFRRLVQGPMVELAQRLGPAMWEIDPLIVTEPRVDRVLSRVYRDTRFSKDKSLYRDVMWCVFMRDRKIYRDPPAFVFEFSPEGFRYGCGYFEAPPRVMAAMRELILKNDRAFTEAREAFEGQKVFGMEGDCYRRCRYPEQPEELRLWLDRKGIAFLRNSKDFDLLFSDSLYETLREGFQTLAPVYRMLCKARAAAFGPG